MQVLYTSVNELNEAIAISVSLTPTLTITNQQLLSEKTIDLVIYNALFSTNDEVQSHSRSLIYQLSELSHIQASSTHDLYQAFAFARLSGFTTPALNVRTLTFDIAQLVFRLMITKQIGAVIFEISRTEMVYTDQSPEQYAVSVLAAAIKAGYQGPVFLQGDHFQLNKDAFIKSRADEISGIKTLIASTINAKFYNIDIDASTLVDLEKSDLADQQQINAQMTAELSEYIRSIQPPSKIISIGAEIGHIGDRNSSGADLKAFMGIYEGLITGEGISKVSVQTGSKHGGTLLADGTLKAVTLDFSILREISAISRNHYHFGGAVQHGASTLPDTAFDKFAENDTLEVHLATGLQNIIYDNLPIALATKLSDWTRAQNASEESGDTNEQTIYRFRKKALGPFKKELWEMSVDEKEKIIAKLEEHLLIIFEKLNIFGTREKVLSLL